MTKKHSHIFFSYSFDDEGKAHKLQNKEVAQELESKALSWVHLDVNDSESKKWLEREVSYLDHLIIDALFAEETRPRVIEFDNGLLVILRGINLNQDQDLENMVSLRLWIDESRIISIQRHNFSAAFEIAQKLEQGKKIKNSGEFLYNLIYEILTLVSPAITRLGDRMDEVEEKVLGNEYDNDLREAIINLRKQATVFKRYMAPQRDVLAHLKVSDGEWINDWARRHFQENHDQVSRIIEELDETRERSQIVHDELSNSITDGVNKSMFKISLIASVFMPLSFFAGLMGMNVGGIPGGSNPSGFYISLFFMMVFLVGAVWLFRRKKWY